MPGHILPSLHQMGMYSKFVPLKSIGPLTNLSGLKLSASIQYFGSLPIAETLTEGWYIRMQPHCFFDDWL